MSHPDCPACGSEEFLRTIVKFGIRVYACNICDRVYLEYQDIISDDKEAVIYETKLELLEVGRQEFAERIRHDAEAGSNPS